MTPCIEELGFGGLLLLALGTLAWTLTVYLVGMRDGREAWRDGERKEEAWRQAIFSRRLVTEVKFPGCFRPFPDAESESEYQRWRADKVVVDKTQRKPVD